MNRVQCMMVSIVGMLFTAGLVGAEPPDPAERNNNGVIVIAPGAVAEEVMQRIEGKEGELRRVKEIVEQVGMVTIEQRIIENGPFTPEQIQALAKADVNQDGKLECIHLLAGFSTDFGYLV